MSARFQKSWKRYRAEMPFELCLIIPGISQGFYDDLHRIVGVRASWGVPILSALGERPSVRMIRDLLGNKIIYRVSATEKEFEKLQAVAREYSNLLQHPILFELEQMEP